MSDEEDEHFDPKEEGQEGSADEEHSKNEVKTAPLFQTNKNGTLFCEVGVDVSNSPLSFRNFSK